MKSSSGEHYIALDHIRAFAAFLVFAWHFNHSFDGVPVSFGWAPVVFPMALIDEGHTGVALFMTLSGYLFAKLLWGKDINYAGFLWNRFIRLAPLLVVVFILAGIDRSYFGSSFSIYEYARSLLFGFVAPTWPNGGWSITIEIQFYIALSIILAITRRHRWAPLMAIAATIMIRAAIFERGGDLRFYAYWTIVGRADDFLLGIAAFNYRSAIERRHMLAASVFLVFCSIWWAFDAFGGYYLIKPRWPWIILPTVEAVSYSILIAYYDASFRPAQTGISKFLSLIGTYSFSIYLLHFFVVFRAAHFIGQRIDISNFYISTLFSAVAFCAMIPIGWASYRFIEGPVLTLRRPYLKTSARLLDVADSERPSHSFVQSAKCKTNS